MGLKYKHSSKTKAQWEALNPVIVENEIVIENDTNALKIGNGIDSYRDLKYVTADYFENSVDYTTSIPGDSSLTYSLGKINRAIIQLIVPSVEFIYDSKEIFLNSDKYVSMNMVSAGATSADVVSIDIEFTIDVDGIVSANIDERMSTIAEFDFSTIRIDIIAK